MSRSSKFGTFGGVFTPSILTILGVIMYLRLPWVVGNSGLWVALGVIAVAHVISITTGLSISSIATDKNVGAGGPYYIVSRSLGLPIGGTLGLALFLGLSFSISLYVIGFCESFLSFLDLEVSPSNIRLAGTAVIVGLTVLTLISTALAIKTQYLILALIGASLVSVFLGGSAPAPAGPLTQPPADAPSLGVIFGIFFPAVTGFTAGVNMSGDLKDPKRSIPSGTMFSIGVGLLVYAALAVFLAYRVDPTQLVSNTDILVQISVVPAAVIAGIWGATLSSALGSILGAPRILQALSVDHITPRWFGKGHGKTNEPRNALLLAFGIGWGGILIAELDVIARVVSMVFLATYGFLNIACAIESWASPDFRPQFRIPRLVSITGALTSIIVMIQLDFAAMAGATILLSGIFLFLKRRQLTLDAGDTWEGIWSSIVRAGLHRLSQGRGQRRNWRPNVLLFSHADRPVRPHLLELSRAFITGNGLLTDFELHDGKSGAPKEDASTDDPGSVGVFRRRTVSEDFYDTVAAACRHHGFTGLDPNTVMLDWSVDRTEPTRFVGLLQQTAKLDFNLLLLHYDAERGFGERKRIDIWWRPSQGNVALSVALMRFLTRFESWQGAQLRFLLVSEDTSLSDDLQQTMRALLADSRVEATIKVVALPSRQGFDSTVRQESADADLVVMGLPPIQRLDEKRLVAMDELVAALGSVLVLQGSSLFAEVLPVSARGAVIEAVERAQLSATKLRPLELPRQPELETPAAAFTEALGRTTEELFTQTLAPTLGQYEALLSDISQLVERQFEIARRGADNAAARSQKQGGRAQSGFLFQARKLLTEFEEEVLPSAARNLQARLETATRRLVDLGGQGPAKVKVLGRLEEVQPDPTDPGWLRRYKRRRRIGAKLGRRAPKYEVPFAAVQRYYAHGRGLDLLDDILKNLQSSSYRLIVQLGKLLNATSTQLSAVLEARDHDRLDPTAIADAERKVLDHLEAARTLARDLTDGIGTRISEETHRLCQDFSNDLQRVGIAHVAARERKPPKKPQLAVKSLEEIPETWSQNQALLLHRARLGLQMAAFGHRFGALVRKVRNDVALQVRNSVLGAGNQLLERLEAFVVAAQAGEAPSFEFDGDLHARFDSQALLEQLARDVDAAVDDLPDTITTLTDDSISALESGVEAETEEVTVSVRPLVKFLVETEFLDVISQEASGIPLQEQRTVGVAQDTSRLLTFSLGDLEAMGGWQNEAVRQQIVSVAKEGVLRLERELQALQSAVDGFHSRIDHQLATLRERTDPYALTTGSDSLAAYIRSREGHKAVSRVRALFARVRDVTRATFVALLYRRSSGVLLARRLRKMTDEAGAPLVDRISAMASGAKPRPNLLRSLPFYYRQLFSGQATISETFWVGREAELERARAALRRHDHGEHGALFVVGETGAGKTALCHVIVTKLLPRRQVYRVVPPVGGTIELAAFRRALEGALKKRGDPDTLLRGVPDGSVFVFDDLEMWWERSERGQQVIEAWMELARRYGDRLVFVANLNVHAWQLINKFVRLSEVAMTVIDCAPLPAESLKSIISLRHGSTGLSFELAGTREEELAPWRQARLFTRYFDFSGGLVAVALRAWLSHIDKVDGNTLMVRWPKRPRSSVLDELRIEFVMLLINLVVHKQMTMNRLARLTGLREDALEADIGPLVRMGLVRRDAQNVLHVDRYVAHLVTERFRVQGMLA